MLTDPHSNMTLDLAQGARLLGSDRWQHYPLVKGYYLYPIPDPQGQRVGGGHPGSRAVADNVRVVGSGTIDGNGWKRTSSSNIVDETGTALPQYVGSSASKVAADRILAASQVIHARENPGHDVINFAAGQGLYGARGRSSADVWIAGNYLRKGHGGVAIGSHTFTNVSPPPGPATPTRSCPQ